MIKGSVLLPGLFWTSICLNPCITMAPLDKTCRIDKTWRKGVNPPSSYHIIINSRSETVSLFLLIENTQKQLTHQIHDICRALSFTNYKIFDMDVFLCVTGEMSFLLLHLQGAGWFSVWSKRIGQHHFVLSSFIERGSFQIILNVGWAARLEWGVTT